jgi:protein phosphatase
MTILLPAGCLVVLVGASGSGKSTFAAKHFLRTETVSSDECRALVHDDPNDQSATDAAFEVLYLIASNRLKARRLTAIDATNVSPEHRAPLVELARSRSTIAVAIVLDLPATVCHARNRARPGRTVAPWIVRTQIRSLRRSIEGLGREGFDRIVVLGSVEEVDAAEVVRESAARERREPRALDDRGVEPDQVR